MQRRVSLIATLFVSTTIVGCAGRDSTAPRADAAQPSHQLIANETVTSAVDPKVVPTPDDGGRILFDTRKSLQQAGDLASAWALFNASAAAPTGWAFTKNVNGTGTHALRIDWQRSYGAPCGTTSPANMALTLPPSTSREFAVSWKWHLGKTSTGGGLGDVGDFVVQSQRCRSAFINRLQLLRDAEIPDSVPYATNAATNGTVLLSVPSPTPNQLAVTGLGTRGITGNQGWEFHPQAHVAVDNDVTLYILRESAPGAADGIVRLYLDGRLFATRANVPTGTSGFRFLRLPTAMTNPARNQSEYLWDFVVWEPGAGPSQSAPPASVATVGVALAASSIHPGQTTQATAQLADSSGAALTDRQVTWSSSDTTLATVSSAGLVTAKAVGTPTITATSEGRSGAAQLSITPPPPVPVASVMVTLASANIIAGQSTQATAVAKDSSGNILAGRAVAWSSSDTTIATVNASGLVASLRAGTALITATIEGFSSGATLQVAPLPPARVTSVTVTLNAPSLTTGQSTQANAVVKDSAGNVLTGRALSWSSSDTTRATVNASGLVSARSAGTAAIIATVETVAGRATLTITNPAPAPVAMVSVTLNAPSLNPLESTQATAVLRDSAGNALTGRTVTWSSSSIAVATVSSSGLVTAVAPGSTQITATSESKSGFATLTVTAPPPPPPPPPGTIPGVVDLNCRATTELGLPAVPLRTFYIDAASGSDANAGTSSAPWQTLDKANSTVRAGDLVYLKGTFSGQWINPAASGNAVNKIVFQTWPGATAILDGGRSGTNIYLYGRSNIVVDGLEVRNSTYAIQVAEGSSFIWLRNLYVHDIGTIWMEQSSDNRIEDSRIERCGSESANSGDCIWIANGSNRNVVARNVMHFAGHSLIDVGGDKTGMAPAASNVVTQNDISNGWANNLGVIGFAQNTIVECNLIHDATKQTTINYARAGMNVAASNNIVRYNLIYGNLADGIQIQGYNFQGLLQSPSGNQFYNNTIYGNGGASVLISQQQDGVVSNTLIANNIFWNNNLAGATDRGRFYNGGSYDVWIDLYAATVIWPAGSMNGNVIQNNILGSTLADAGKQWMIIVTSPNRTYTLAQAQATFGSAVSGNREVDPLLNVGDLSFTLQAGSPAIDAGTVVVMGQKFTGSAPDLGARDKP